MSNLTKKFTLAWSWLLIQFEEKPELQRKINVANWTIEAQTRQIARLAEELTEARLDLSAVSQRCEHLEGLVGSDARMTIPEIEIELSEDGLEEAA